MSDFPSRVAVYMAGASVPLHLFIIEALLHQHRDVTSVDYVIGDRRYFRWASARSLDPRIRLHYQHEHMDPFGDARPLDGERLAELEARYGLPHLWRYVMVQRSISDFSEARKLAYLRAYLEYFEKVAHETRAELFITGMPDSLPFLTAAEVFRRNGVATVTLAPGRLPGRFFVVDDELEQIPGLAAAYDRVKERGLAEDDEARIGALRERYARRAVRPPRYGWGARLGVLPSPRRIVDSVLRRWRDDERYFDFSLAYYARRSVMLRVRRPVQEFALARATTRTLGDLPYFYMPLNIDPECTIDVQSSYFREQLAVVRRVVAGLPAGHELYVKEHPNMLPAARPLGFYEELGRMSSVRVLARGVDSFDIVERCAGVITIGGTTAVEALFYGKPVLLLGRAFYEVFHDGVFRVSAFEDIALGLRWMLDHPRVPAAAFNCFLAAVLERSYAGAYELPDPLTLDRGNIEAIARAISQEIAYRQGAA